MLFTFETHQIVLTTLLFVWTGFVRSGLGFGGAALGLPLLLFVHNQPIDWLPIIGFHLLIFSGLTLRTRLNNVDWNYLKRAGPLIVPSALVGVFGLITFPNQWLVIFIYSVTLIYAVIWLMNWSLVSNNNWLDRMFLVSGGYIAGTSLTGAPLMVAVFARNVTHQQLRNTLFVLWFTLVAIKMSTFALLSIDLQFMSAVALLPTAAIGHYIGLKVHDMILSNDTGFKRVIGAVLIFISSIGLYQVINI
ncbi:MAG: TSUP family transporter [Gammaproteobacteria bacterium]|nr:TSUP family transporter [Gammaproteobacteria bacterium]MDH5800107.1 TSUP family transporter [Gammaproteobacteria bacterium]